jgi:hypothetical protein
VLTPVPCDDPAYDDGEKPTRFNIATRPDPSTLCCNRCAKTIHPGRGDYYLVRIEAIADPAPPGFTQEDLAIDFDQEFKKLVEQTRQLTARQAMDQVYRRVVLNLCVS